MQTIVALYEDVDTAKAVIRQLKNSGIAEGEHIDLFVNVTENAVLSVKVTKDGVNQATHIIYRHEPLQIDRHDVQWRRNGSHYSTDERK